MKIYTLVLFLLTYVLMIALPKFRPWVAAISAGIFLITGIVPVTSLGGAIDFNVLMMLAGTMGTVALFIESRMPSRMAELLLQSSPNVMWVVVIMSLFAGFVSAFVDNVATVLMVAPVGLAIAKKLNISPVGMIIAIAVSSNLQGAATLVGDTTSIMLGGYANMNFLDFFVLNGKPSIFFAVELGALATVPVMLFLFRDQKQKVTVTDRTVVSNYVPSILLVSTVLGLIGVSFWDGRPSMTNGFICVGVFLIGLIYTWFRDRDFVVIKQSIREIDFQTLILLAGLFVVIDGITEVGIIDDISRIMVDLGGDNLFIIFTVIVFGSVLFSAFVDNIPYVATMLPVVAKIAAAMGCSPYLLFFGLLSGATLGGNLTPIGASANIAAIGILRKAGYEVKAKDFFRIGVPFTLCAVLVGYVFCWLVWGLN